MGLYEDLESKVDVLERRLASLRTDIESLNIGLGVLEMRESKLADFRIDIEDDPDDNIIWFDDLKGSGELLEKRDGLEGQGYLHQGADISGNLRRIEAGLLVTYNVRPAQLGPGQPGPRIETGLWEVGNTAKRFAREPFDKKLFYEFEIYLSRQLQTPADDFSRSIFFQIHAASKGDNPILSLDYWRHKDRWVWMTSNHIDGHEKIWPEPNNEDITVANNNVEYDTWVKWRIESIWSPSSDGYIEIFKDDEMVAQVKGVTAYNEEEEPYQRFGVYYPSGRKEPPRFDTHREIVFRNFKKGYL